MRKQPLKTISMNYRFGIKIDPSQSVISLVEIFKLHTSLPECEKLDMHYLF